MRSILLALFLVLAVPAAASANSSLKLSNGVLTYTDSVATDVNNLTIGVSPDGTRVTVTEAGKTSRNRAITITGDTSCPASGSVASCTLSAAKSIAVDTGGANDTIVQSTSLPSKLTGGAGNDTITGGGGDDVFPDDAGADTLVGGAGNDTVDYSAVKTPVVVSLDSQPGDGAAGENDNVGADIEGVTGGSANDVITGSPADNGLGGGAGDDVISGGAGNDNVDGGAGNDQVSGGDGNDQLAGGADNDSLTGDAGDDVLNGGTGADSLVGGDGADTATYADSPTGVRVVLDGKANDGAAGENDNADTENLVGSNGDDVLIGNVGANVIGGLAGNDRILGGKGSDLLDGGSGDDILEALDGAKDAVNCGDGEDGVVTDRADVRTACDYIKYRTLAATATALHMSNGYVRAPVRCSPAVAEKCRGRVYVKIGRKVVGSRAFSLTPGRRWVAKIKLAKTGVKAVRKAHVTTATLSVHDRQAIPTTQTIRIAG